MTVHSRSTARRSATDGDAGSALRIGRERAQCEQTQHEQCHIETHSGMLPAAPVDAPRAPSQYTVVASVSQHATWAIVRTNNPAFRWTPCRIPPESHPRRAGRKDRQFPIEEPRTMLP